MSSIVDRLKQIAESPTRSARRYASEHPSPPSDTDELSRILALPRRSIPTEEAQAAMAAAMTARLARPNPKCGCALLRPEVVARGLNPCITSLRPIQGWLLTEAAELGGAVGALAVGAGKTALDILLPMVVPGCKLAVLLLPPGLRDQFRRDYLAWSQHFQVPNLVGGPGPFFPDRPRLEILAYSELSLAKNSTWFALRKPDVVIADEAHSLKDRAATRTGRFLKHFATEPGTRFFCHSGSITTRSPCDYGHLSALALKEQSPVPLDPNVLQEWSEALAPGMGIFQTSPGTLKNLCEPGEPLRKAFHRRLTETKGVVATVDVGLPTRLLFDVRKPPPMPAEVTEALAGVRRRSQRPDGEELRDALEVATVARQVAAGFYLYWAYPRGEPEELIEEWFGKRQAWNREVRETLEHRADHLDSPKLLENAAERFEEGYDGPLPVWRSNTLKAWKGIEDRVQPVTRVKWISDWLARDAAEWGKQSPGIIWYLNPAVGRRVAELGDFPCYGEGEDAARGILDEKGDRTIVASIRAHYQGRNLQAFNRSLILQPPSDGGTYEQLIGRTHRSGQTAEAVRVTFYQHTPEYTDALNKATELARYTQDTLGSPQKLIYGEWAESGGTHLAIQAD